MAIVRPFKAIRPTRDKAHLFATRSYLTYSDETLKEKLDNNPFTFLHILNPEYKKKVKQKGIKKFKLVKQKFEEFKEDGVLKKDKNVSFYLYRQSKNQYVFEGIIAACSIDDYLSGTIKIHEHTITKREEMFTNYLSTTNFNADPVLLSYQDNNTIDNLIEKVCKERAEYNFTTTNKAQHQLWLIDKKEDINSICNAFEKIEKVYIADGHHRSASSALLAQKLGAKMEENANYFMSFLIAESQLNIINFNRLVKKLNGLTTDEFISKIKANFEVKLVNTDENNPVAENEISMYISGEWFSLILKSGSKMW